MVRQNAMPTKFETMSTLQINSGEAFLPPRLRKIGGERFHPPEIDVGHRKTSLGAEKERESELVHTLSCPTEISIDPR
jgi:hypothetical protein